MTRFMIVMGMLVGFSLAPAGAASPPSAPAAPEEPYHDSCFGDRYESDADLNDGNEISDRELRELLEQLNSPGA